MIPTLTLGVPGSSIAALMLGALLIQGFQPGPQLFRDAPEVVYGYSWQMFLTSALLIVFGGSLANRFFANILRIPQAMLLPLIVCMVVAGGFAAQNSIFDVYLAFLFGLVGLAMVRFGFPIAPVIIGVVLGTKAEFNLRISLLMSGGEPSILYNRPICIALIALSALVLFYPGLRYLKELVAAAAGWAQRRVAAGRGAAHVGWAKRSVPTHLRDVFRVGTARSAPFAAPYGFQGRDRAVDWCCCRKLCSVYGTYAERNLARRR